MSDGPEQEHDTHCTQQRVHDVHPFGHLRGVAGKLGKQVGREHEERGTWGVTNLHFITCGDEFGTVPKTGCRLYCGAINEGGYQETNPA